MNCDSWLVPKNELITEDRVLALIRSIGLNCSLSRTFILSRIVLAILERPTLNWLASCSPTVRTRLLQVVDVIDGRLGVDKLDEILDDLDDVCVGQNPSLRVCCQTEFLVQTEPSDVAEVISLLGEEEFVDDVPGGRLIRWF